MCPDEHRNKIRPIMSFSEDIRANDVPDPYYDNSFDRVFQYLNSACRALVKDQRAN